MIFTHFASGKKRTLIGGGMQVFLMTHDPIRSLHSYLVSASEHENWHYRHSRHAEAHLNTLIKKILIY